MLPRLHFTLEKWKFSEYYGIWVSSCGHFKDKNKKVIIPNTNKTGYLVVKTQHGISFAHRVILHTFKPVSDSKGLTVDHIDGNKKNNTLKNLEWVSKEENQQRAKDNFLELKNEIEYLDPQVVSVMRKNSTEKFIYFGDYRVKTVRDAAEIILRNWEDNYTEKEFNRIVAKIGNALKDGTKTCGFYFERRV